MSTRPNPTPTTPTPPPSARFSGFLGIASLVVLAGALVLFSVQGSLTRNAVVLLIVAALLGALYVIPRWGDLVDWLRSRQARQGGNVTLASVAFIGLLAVGNWAVNRHSPGGGPDREPDVHPLRSVGEGAQRAAAGRQGHRLLPQPAGGLVRPGHQGPAAPVRPPLGPGDGGVRRPGRQPRRRPAVRHQQLSGDRLPDRRPQRADDRADRAGLHQRPAQADPHGQEEGLLRPGAPGARPEQSAAAGLQRGRWRP